MKQQMKNRYRLFKRGWGVYYVFNNDNGNSESLHTRGKAEATRLVHTILVGERRLRRDAEAGTRDVCGFCDRRDVRAFFARGF